VSLKRLAALLLTAAAVGAAAQPLKLHVPSPDWREQIVYFVMTDRFADGDPRNNDQGAGVFDPTRVDRYNGGDLKGITERLGYIQGLGATAVWLTPPVKNQWFDPLLGYTGYHGYWAQHFKQVDPHVGTLADYKALSSALHGRGMFLVQDIVVNHVGNYFDYVGGFDATDPTRFYVANTKSRPSARPTQPPFHLNDPRRALDRAAGVYHWTPPLVDIQQPGHELTHQMSGLDDLNTENPRVRRALRDSFGFWVREVGVDALRVDTAFYVPPLYFDDFMNARDAKAPGLREAARRSGRRDFFVFGEGFGIDRAGEETLSRRIESYVTGPKGEHLLDGMLNFSFYGALVDVFARGRPPAALADRVQRMMRVHRRAHWMPSFADNHDVDRWLAGGTVAGLEQSLLAIMTLPGVPVLYYGTEQGFTEQRGAMFAKGFASGGRDRYDTRAPLYRRIAELAALRRSDRVFTHGVPTMLHAAQAGPGALAWRMAHEGRSAFVVMNTAGTPALLDNLQTGLPEGTRLAGRFGFAGRPADVVVGTQGRVHLVLPPHAGMVWAATPGRAASVAAPPAIALDALPAEALDGDFELTGQAPPGGALQIVIDGDLTRTLAATADAQGRFSARIPTGRMTDAALTHRVVAWSDGVASAAREFRVAQPWRVVADVDDPEGDDRGPDGGTRYPTHASFAPGQMDLRRVRVSTAGGALRVELTLGAFSRVWGPPNGFDHVAFSLFIELPGREGGAAAMPLQNAVLPDGMRWHVRARAHGWSNALFGARGADASAEGESIAPAATIETDAAGRSVSFTFPAAALGDAATLSGARLYVTTWDYDGGWRELAREAGPFTMGSASAADPARAPKVMDASALIRLP
jgi:glycosidase